MMNDGFYERRRFSKKRNKDKSKNDNTYIPYQKKYSLKNLLSDIGNRNITNFFESGLIQAKLNVSQSGDFYEQEADRIANNIVNTNTSRNPKVSRVQAKSATTNLSVNSSAESKVKNLKGKGSSLNKSVRDYFEPRLGVDLGNVRVHTDNNANLLAKAINARAFTHGNDIVFGKGEYEPNLLRSKKLIAHELAHTIQQNGGASDVVQRKGEYLYYYKYRVVNGDYLGKLAIKFNTTVSAIKNENSKIKGDVIKRGEYYIIPTDTAYQGSSIDMGYTYFDENEGKYFSVKSPEDYANDVMDAMYEEEGVISAIQLADIGWKKMVSLDKNKLIKTLTIIKSKDLYFFNILSENMKSCRLSPNYMNLAAECLFSITKIDNRTEEIQRKDFQVLKDLISKVSQGNIDKFCEITGNSWGKILLNILCLNYTGVIGSTIINKAIDINNIQSLNKNLEKDFGYSKIKLTITDLYNALFIFQSRTVEYANKLIEKNIEIATTENDRYKNNNSDVNELYNTIKTLYCKDSDNSFYEANYLRIEALRLIITNGYPGGLGNPVAEEILKKIPKKDQEILKSAYYGSSNNFYAAYKLAKCSRGAADYFINQLIIRSGLQEEKCIECYEKLGEANQIENNIIEDEKKALNRFPVLANLNYDYYKLAQDISLGRKDISDFRKELFVQLNASIKSGNETIKKFKSNPEKVWELAPLIKLSMKNEDIKVNDNVGKIIWDRVKDVDFDLTLRSYAMAGVAIVLGIAGACTGGAGMVILGAIGAGISALDLYLEIDTYTFKKNAKYSTFEGEFSGEPGLLGIALAIVGLLFDVVDVGVGLAKAIKASSKALKGVAKAASAADDIIDASNDLTKAAAKEYDRLSKLPGFDPKLTKDECIEIMVDAAKKAGKNSTDTIKISKQLRKKLLWGVQPDITKNNVIGAHFRGIIDHPDYAVEIIGRSSINPDCLVVKFTKSLPEYNISKLKRSTLFPKRWEKNTIIKAIEEVANNSTSSIIEGSREILTGTVKGIKIRVIIENGVITAGYPL